MPPRNALQVFVSTKSINPLSALVRIITTDEVIQFEVNDEMAQAICAGLEHFLTQDAKLHSSPDSESRTEARRTFAESHLRNGRDFRTRI